jgi:hypothetical protein
MNETKLPREFRDHPIIALVYAWAVEEAKDNRDDRVWERLQEVQDHGLWGASVGAMVYDGDIGEFLDEHIEDINKWMSEDVNDFGPMFVFGAKNWDWSDPLWRETNNRMYIASYAWERAARLLLDWKGEQ